MRGLKFLAVIAVASMTAAAAMAQVGGAAQPAAPMGSAPSAGGVPATPGGGRGGGAPAAPALNSAEVAQDGRVTFRIRAPAAQAVNLVLEPGGPNAMTKDSAGVWSFTTASMAPDLYAYRFSVDGVNQPDLQSGATLKSGRPGAAMEWGALGGLQSQVLVPNRAKPEAWELTDIPHGNVTQVVFRSAAMNAFRDYYVYTPPGYNPRRAERYPVLYLLHGAGENGRGWLDIGRANLILDTLIAEGRARPMIVVTPLGHPGQPLRGDQATPAQPGGASPYMTSLLSEIIPAVERDFNAGDTKAMRAIAGLSMGGGQTFNIALMRPEMFDYVGMFSPAVGMGGGGISAAATAQWGGGFKTLWIGTGDNDTLTGPGTTALKAALRERGVRFTEDVIPGGHTYAVWKRNLIEFAPLLFR